jgi:hypothetical protein
MTWKIRQVGGAIWHYLNQPLWPSEPAAIWEPSRFWYVYQIQLLEICWQISNTESHLL